MGADEKDAVRQPQTMNAASLKESSVEANRTLETV